jgi:hypothetical protein
MSTTAHKTAKINSFAELSRMGQLALQAKRKQGEPAGRVRLGFLRIRQNGILIDVPDPEVMPLILEARELHAGGMSIRAVLEIMTERGLKTRKGKELRAMDLWRAIQTK